MNETANNCPKCRGLMEEGFILDHGDMNVGLINTWVEGAPVKSFWNGIKISNKSQFAVKTFRCVDCGYLESYATEEINKDSKFY